MIKIIIFLLSLYCLPFTIRNFTHRNIKFEYCVYYIPYILKSNKNKTIEVTNNRSMETERMWRFRYFLNTEVSRSGSAEIFSVPKDTEELHIVPTDNWFAFEFLNKHQAKKWNRDRGFH